MRHEFSIQTVSSFLPELSVTKPTELTLEQKVMLANHPNVKAMLQQQLEVEKAHIASENVLTYQTFVQEAAEQEAKKLGIKNKFRIFLQADLDGQKEMQVVPGVIVHIHLYTTAKRIVTPEFWDGIRRALIRVPSCSRSCALVVRDYYWQQREEFIPKWKKIRIEDTEIEFNLVKPNSYSTTEEIKIVKRHKATGLTVIVSGWEMDRASLEREALVLLSQQVAMYNYMNKND